MRSLTDFVINWDDVLLLNYLFPDLFLAVF